MGTQSHLAIAPGAVAEQFPLPPIERARQLVLRYGWNATAYQIVNPGIDLWFSAAGDGVVGFVEAVGVRVVAGGPVCAAERLPAIVAEFEDDAAREGFQVCYFGGEGRLEALAHRTPGRALVVLGAQPSWDPRRWADIVAHRASLRAQLNRARNKGVVVERVSAEWATANAELARCLGEWLATRGLPPMHFLVEPETLERLWDRRVYVARREGEVVAFLIASPVPARNGWLTEQFVRGWHAPNGTLELLIDAAMRDFAASDSSYATMGLSPLSRRAGVGLGTEPGWLRLLLRWVRAHGRRFYNFEGLDAFKAKFQPETWEPIYAVSQSRSFSPRLLYAIAQAFAGQSPERVVAYAFVGAAREEVRRLLVRFRRWSEAWQAEMPTLSGESPREG